MPFIYTKNEMDNALFQEISNINQDEDNIVQLIKDGANVNAIDCKDDTVIANLIDNISHENIDIKYLKLLINLGADVNLRVNGVNCLFNAVHTYRKDIFRVLLEAGADPNCIIDDEGISILDMIIDDKYFCEMENDLEEAKMQEEIEKLLVSYGAKNSKKLYAIMPNKYIWINTIFETGLLTYTGNIKPENIPNINIQLVNEFNKWLERKPREWGLPKTFFQEYYNDGIIIAREFKKILGTEIEVKINYLTCELWEENQRGKYEWKIIEA